MNVYMTFSGATYDDTTKRIVEDGPQFGADAVWVYDDKWLMEQPFYQQNRWLWDHPHKRGFGWYAWKPFIIWDALSKLNDGDVVLYTDADTFPIAPLGVLFQMCRFGGGMMLFASENHFQKEWCKRDCYAVMGQMELRDTCAPAGVARFMLFEKGPWRTSQFLMEWLTYAVNPLANTFDASTFGMEVQEFVEHRAEQAILTNLAHKYGLKLYREACQAGNSIDRDRDLYGQLFSQVNADESKVTTPALGSVYATVGP